MRHKGTRIFPDGHQTEPVQSVTSAPVSNADDQGVRVRRYLVAMGTRTVCFVLAIVASGWVRWTLVVAAVVLPYIAVVLANAVGPRFGQSVAPVRPVARTRTALSGVVDDSRSGRDTAPAHPFPSTTADQARGTQDAAQDADAAQRPDDEQHPRAG